MIPEQGQKMYLLCSKIWYVFFSDSNDHPLISAKLPILTDACYYYNFSGTIQRNDSKKRKTEQMEEKTKNESKECH